MVRWEYSASNKMTRRFELPCNYYATLPIFAGPWVLVVLPSCLRGMPRLHSHAPMLNFIGTEWRRRVFQGHQESEGRNRVAVQWHMTETRPLVTVMIATRDRAPELSRTLRELRFQDYHPMEVLVIDDGSRDPMEPLVATEWPGATVIRHDKSAGQSLRRNEGFARARGEYILHLDDDCHLVGSNSLSQAVRELADRSSAAAVIFDLYNGPDLPPDLPPSPAPTGCVRSFIGAAALFRRSAIAQTAGYRPFYLAQGEEEELALQLLSRGWQLIYIPTIVAHHRLSGLNRNSEASWGRAIGNDVWTLITHMPMYRLPGELSWRLAIATWDSIRLGRTSSFGSALKRCVLGIPAAWALRSPLDALALRRFDAMRFRSTLSELEFSDPPRLGFADVAAWWRRWRNRAREANHWDKGVRNVGSSLTSRHSHELRKRHE